MVGSIMYLNMGADVYSLYSKSLEKLFSLSTPGGYFWETKDKLYFVNHTPTEIALWDVLAQTLVKNWAVATEPVMYYMPAQDGLLFVYYTDIRFVRFYVFRMCV